MSWMDSWSRPTKSQATPPPFYLTQGDDVRYCHTCGRLIGGRRINNSKGTSTEARYCRTKCSRNKPSTAPGSLNVRIESAIEALLQGQEPDVLFLGKSNDTVRTTEPKPKVKKGKKGDHRVIVKMSDIETAVFGKRKDSRLSHSRNKSGAKRHGDSDEFTSVDMEEPTGEAELNVAHDTEGDDRGDGKQDSGGEVPFQLSRVRPPQSQSAVNGSIGGEKSWVERVAETPEMLEKRLEGQKLAEERELVRNCARRAVVFGVPSHESPKRGEQPLEQPREMRQCEALMSGKVVEPSFAKGDWCIRWRED